MSFASPIFLWYFLPLTLLATWLLPARARNAVVAIASLLFYAVGGGALLTLLIATIAFNYLAGLRLARDHDPYRRKLLLIGAVGADITLLAVWKYADFASRQLDTLTHNLGLGHVPVLHLALPIGISFYVFHLISYVVDVYRDVRKPLHSPLAFVTYVCMFPQLIAGPIVRFHEIADQLTERTTSRMDDLIDGFPRFCLGLTKKVVIADSLAPVVQAGFDTPTNQLTTTTAWVAVLAYTLQIYFDFSGYSDMAIGLGRMIGFQLPENFNRPYSAHSITDFWRRWHMSLSRWFRDYVYVPLGGNRISPLRTYANLWIVFLLCGLWHGANWTFIVWGAYHGALLVIERMTGLAPTASGPVVIVRRALVMLLVSIGWVFFRANSLGHALGMLGRMFSVHGSALTAEVSAVLTNQRSVMLALAVLVLLVPSGFVMGRFVQFSEHRSADLVRVAYITVGLGYAAIVLAAGTFSPFLYYQF